MTRNPQLLCKKLGISFRDMELLTSALTHRSAGARNNERLEFLGDAVLGYVIADRLYERLPEAKEGVLSRLRSTLVNQTSLAELARQLDLGEHLILGSGELKSGGHRRDSILSDAMEAIIGAIAKDQGLDPCREWVLNLFAERIEKLAVQSLEKDPKTRLQELMQSRGFELPVYTLAATKGLPHEQCFSVECRVPLLAGPGVGTGTSRKRAEQQAAEQVLAKLWAEHKI